MSRHEGKQRGNKDLHGARVTMLILNRAEITGSRAADRKLYPESGGEGRGHGTEEVGEVVGAGTGFQVIRQSSQQGPAKR